jgi:hypothetical protein
VHGEFVSALEEQRSQISEPGIIEGLERIGAALTAYGELHRTFAQQWSSMQSALDRWDDNQDAAVMLDLRGKAEELLRAHVVAAGEANRRNAA